MFQFQQLTCVFCPCRPAWLWSASTLFSWNYGRLTNERWEVREASKARWRRVLPQLNVCVSVLPGCQVKIQELSNKKGWWVEWCPGSAGPAPAPGRVYVHTVVSWDDVELVVTIITHVHHQHTEWHHQMWTMVTTFPSVEVVEQWMQMLPEPFKRFYLEPFLSSWEDLFLPCSFKVLLGTVITQISPRTF